MILSLDEFGKFFNKKSMQISLKSFDMPVNRIYNVVAYNDSSDDMRGCDPLRHSL